MDTSDHSVSASQRAQPSPAAPHAPIQTPDLVDLVGRFSSLDAQGKQSMVDCLVQTIVAQSGRNSIPGKSTELNEILKNMILVLQQQIQSGKGVDFQQLQVCVCVCVCVRACVVHLYVWICMYILCSCD